MVLYNTAYIPNFEWVLPDYLMRTLLATIASEQTAEAAKRYPIEVIQDYPEAQIL